MDLFAQRDKLRAEYKRCKEHLDMMDESGFSGLNLRDVTMEDSQADQHPADQGSEMFEREKDLGLQDLYKRRLSGIQAALDDLTNGTYGLCEDCHQPIAEERLDANPSARTCLLCQERREAPPDRFHRPIEEMVLSPPFGRTWRDGTGDPGYDGEDAWQDAGVHGTSETTQDVPGARSIEELYHSHEDVQGAVDIMDVLVDETGEPLQLPWRDHDGYVHWDDDDPDAIYSTLYGPDDMEGDYEWEPSEANRDIKPERQFGAQFPH